MEIYASYEVQIEGYATITTRITDSPRLLNTFLSDLRSRILNDQNVENNNQSESIEIKKPIVVGLAMSPANYFRNITIMQLCFGTRCVIIQLLQLAKEIPESLRTFLADEDIAFVGVDIRSDLAKLESAYGIDYRSVIELGTLVDRVYRKSKFSEYNLEELANKLVGFEIEKHFPWKLNHELWEIRDLKMNRLSMQLSMSMLVT